MELRWRACVVIWALLTLAYTHHVTGYVININRDVPLEKTIKRSVDDISHVTDADHVSSSSVNDTVVEKGNHSHHEGTEKDHATHKHDHTHGVHHSIHVISWNFRYVEAPFIIAVFLIVAGIAKLGKVFLCKL